MVEGKEEDLHCCGGIVTREQQILVENGRSWRKMETSRRDSGNECMGGGVRGGGRLKT